ncbi:LIM domain-binding protein 2-like [Clavelina lepadiformis]|uniref:LIM interaction domain-containing protein n=1 Tax=Clavelina lepadiformis TaxID=159417 RepID=A0ABP0G182_CLALP
MPIRPSCNPAMDMRHPAYSLAPDYKIYQMNKWLQDRVDDCDSQWWDRFVTEFFEEKSTLTLSFMLEDGPKRYTIGRTLIPRFFRTMHDSGVVDMSLILRVPKDFYNSSNNCRTLDCEHATMVMQHMKPVPTKVCVEGHFVADFSPDEMMRMKSWHFSIRSHLEYIPKQVPMQHPNMMEELCKNVTRVGLTSPMINYLKMCVVIEPMKELMSRQKTYSMDPRDCLRNCLFQKWQQMLNPAADSSRSTKRPSRKRKNSSNHAAANSNQGHKKKGFTSSSDVMMVGEPTLMGCEFGDEDERPIQRLENNQFDGQINIKSEERETPSSTFPGMSSPSTTQWQHQNTATTSAMPAAAMIAPKSEPAEPGSNQTPPNSSST